MRSLRVQLLVGLIALYAASAAVTVLLDYRQYKSNISASWDGEMRALAVSYAGRLVVGDTVPPLSQLDDYAVQHHGAQIVQFWRADGTLTATSWPIAGLGLLPDEGFCTVRLDGHRWRVFTMQSTPLRVQIVTSDDFRQRVIWDITRNAAKPIVYLAPISSPCCGCWCMPPCGR